jgi:hypothetical protein
MKNTIFFLLVLSLTSCSTVNKLFHKDKKITDSVAVIHERKDSTVTKDSVAVHSSQSENTDEIVVDYGDKQITVPYNDTTGDSGIYITPKNPDDYFYFNSKTGEIKSNRTPVKITVRRRGVANTYDSIAEHSQITLSDVKDDSVRVQSKDKTVTKEVHKTRTWWLLLLLIPAFLIIRYWKTIKAYFIFLFTGL